MYWRYELWLRAQESALASVTAGNGAIYAVRREAYVEVDPVMGHDLSFPFLMVKRGRRAVYAPEARATEKMVPTIEGEWRRKRRMMSHAWPIVLRGGLLSPRGYGAAVRADDRLAPAAALRLARAARRDRAARALARAGPSTARRARRPRGAAGRGAGGRRRPARGRCCSRATTCSPPPRSPPGSTTTCATARRRAGTRRRARGDLPSGKRALDVVLGGAALVLCARCWPSSAVLIRLETHGHPIYRQRRVGRDGEPFELYKLRTMVTGAEAMGAGLVVDAGDARITRTGAWLRRYSIDELPNLINVLAGEMSLVGPRPTVQVQVDHYSERQRGRLAVRPGHHGLGAGQRPRVAALARAHRARPLVRRARLARARPPHHVAEPADGVRRPRALPRRDRRLAPAAARVLGQGVVPADVLTAAEGWSAVGGFVGPAAGLVALPAFAGRTAGRQRRIEDEEMPRTADLPFLTAQLTFPPRGAPRGVPRGWCDPKTRIAPQDRTLPSGGRTSPQHLEERSTAPSRGGEGAGRRGDDRRNAPQTARSSVTSRPRPHDRRTAPPDGTVVGHEPAATSRPTNRTPRRARSSVTSRPRPHRTDVNAPPDGPFVKAGRNVGR